MNWEGSQAEGKNGLMPQFGLRLLVGCGWEGWFLKIELGSFTCSVFWSNVQRNLHHWKSKDRAPRHRSDSVALIQCAPGPGQQTQHRVHKDGATMERWPNQKAWMSQMATQQGQWASERQCTVTDPPDILSLGPNSSVDLNFSRSQKVCKLSLIFAENKNKILMLTKSWCEPGSF